MELRLVLSGIPAELVKKQAISSIVGCNEKTFRFGLALTEKQAADLVETRELSLRNTGRVEFGEGIIGRLIYEFCDSPYIYQKEYAQTLNELIEIFYYCKNESGDRFSDDMLIGFMRDSFNGECHGSVELLASRLDSLIRGEYHSADADRRHTVLDEMRSGRDGDAE